MRNVAELLAQRTTEQPEAEFVRYRGDAGIRSLTRGEFSRQAAAWSDALRARGIGRGDRVALVSEKSLEAKRAFFAVFSTGATCVPAAEELPAAELAFIFSDAEPRLVLSSDTFAGKVREAVGP